MKYKSIKEYKIVPKGVILEPNEDGEYIFEVEEDGIVTSMVLSSTMLKDEEYFKPHEHIEVTISEDELDSSTKKNWKVVFNLKCTEKQLLEVKRFIEEGVSEIL